MFCKITITESTLNRLLSACDSLDADVEKGINQLIDEHFGERGLNVDDE